MEAVNRDNMLRDRGQRPTIEQVVYKFLDNIKLRFGEQSTEVITILNILGTFRAGEISKKDTLVAIRLTLGDQADLKQDLLNILFHRQADWAVGDFDFGLRQPLDQASPSPSPQFLQPAHQSQMRLPPISPLWYEASQANHSAKSVEILDPGSSTSFGMLVPPPAHHIPDRFCRPDPFTSPGLTDSASVGSNVNENHEAGGSYAGKLYDTEGVPHLGHAHDEGQQTSHLEEPRAYYSQSWSSVAGKPILGHVESLPSNHFDSPAPSHEMHMSPDLSPRKGQAAVTNPFVLGVPIAVPIGQPIDEMPPPSKKRRRRQSSTSQVKAGVEPSRHNSEIVSHILPSAEIADKLLVPAQPNRMAKEDPKPSQGGGGPYIHSLCGKGFSSRSKVKKHHWGNKLDNLETTTGCWAKNKKPNVSWNEHPSCREGIPQRKAPSIVQKPRTLNQKAPQAPSMVPRSQDIPQISAQASHFRQEREQSFEDVGSYHSHRLPTRSSFDNLLTAVNIASQIDAPQPQGRIDSVVSHLDAAAAEHNRQYITNWQDASNDHDEESLAYGHQHPYTTQGLGLRGVHVPVHMALPDLERSFPQMPSSHSLPDSLWNYGRELVFDSTKRHYAALGSPFSPGAGAEHRQT